MARPREVAPEGVWALLSSERVPVLDLRTRWERRLFGAPPGSRKVSLVAHTLWPRRDAIYLCQHAVRSKLPAWRGAQEVAGGFVAWQACKLPITGGRSAGRR